MKQGEKDHLDYQRAKLRVTLVGVLMIAGFALVGARMGSVATTETTGGHNSVTTRGDSNLPVGWQGRSDIVDRQGRSLAMNMPISALYAQPQDLIEPILAAEALAEIFPDLDVERLKRDFTGERKFLWLKRQISPEQRQAVFDIGEPGLLFAQRYLRIYPNGQLAAHILGGVRFGVEGVRSAEIVGVAGVERFFDGWLKNPANAGKPLELSLDLSVQAAVEQVLGGGISMMNAIGGAAVLMDVQTGEVLAMASYPDFDPNNRPLPPAEGNPAESPLFNRAVQGLYEFGSTFKIFPVAAGLQDGLISTTTRFETTEPYMIGRYRIREISRIPAEMDVAEILRRSSNIGSVKIALTVGGERLAGFLGEIGVTSPSPIELAEAARVIPSSPGRWPDITVATISYGYGLTTSVVNLAAAYASLVNGGLRVTPTILRQSERTPGVRVVSEKVSRDVRAMLRAVVTDGTASFARIQSYSIGGKTGTAEKVSAEGGYDTNKAITTFASFFPAQDPRYVLVTTLDEAVESSGAKPRTTSGWTVVPVGAEIVARVGPLLGLRPG